MSGRPPPDGVVRFVTGGYATSAGSLAVRPRMSRMPRPSSIHAIAGRLRRAARVTVLTGAGVSTASGIPTFRGPAGLWRSHRPEQLATPEAFARDPVLVWEWYDWRRQRILAARPNPAHDVLARWSHDLDGATLITQNVDGLHERAGARDVLRFHGSIWELRCWDACPGAPAPWIDRTAPLAQLPPRCPACNGLARPNVVWFGEAIDDTVLRRSTESLRCDLFLAVGTSAVVYPAAGLIAGAKRAGAFTAEINVDDTGSSGLVDLVVRGRAEAVLVEIDASLLR